MSPTFAGFATRACVSAPVRSCPLLADVRVNLETLGEQKSLVDHLSEKLARLEFTTQEAHTLESLQRERELAERIEHGIKQLRSGSVPAATVEGKLA